MDSDRDGVKKRYEPPRVLRLDAAGEAAGDCVAGSGNVDDCTAGLTAGAGCNAGTSASGCLFGEAA